MVQDHRHSFRVQGPPTREPQSSGERTYELSVSDSRELDRLCVDQYGIPEIILMENAAIGLCNHALDMLGDAQSPTVVICCGPGNNGGDGLAMARHLFTRRIAVKLVMLIDGRDMRGSSLTNFQITQNMGIETQRAEEWLGSCEQRPATLLIDALFGTGLGRVIEGTAGGILERINQLGPAGSGRCKVLSVDIPSGLDGDTGAPIGERVVVADRTVTMAGLKPGLRMIEAQAVVGEVVVVPIGAPPELLESIGRRVEPRAGAGD